MARAKTIESLNQRMQEWPLESIYPIVWLDAIHGKIREKD